MVDTQSVSWTNMLAARTPGLPWVQDGRATQILTENSLDIVRGQGAAAECGQDSSSARLNGIAGVILAGRHRCVSMAGLPTAARLNIRAATRPLPAQPRKAADPVLSGPVRRIAGWAGPRSDRRGR